VGNPDLTAGKDFVTKLGDQLAGHDDDVVLLAAELLALLLLPLQDWKQSTKHERVSRVLGFMAEPVAVPDDVVAAFAGGVLNGQAAHPGTLLAPGAERARARRLPLPATSHGPRSAKLPTTDWTAGAPTA
jgi:hypothetical protein